MNQYFWTKVDKLRKGIPASNINPLDRIAESTREKTCKFKFRMVNEEEIRKSIMGLKASTATGVDSIDSNCLKAVAEVVAPA